MAIERPEISELQIQSSNRYLHYISPKIMLIGSGLFSDIRHVVNRARKEAESYRTTFDEEITLSVLVDKISLYMQAHTLYSSVRPFGASLLISDHKELYSVGPYGDRFKCSAFALGRESRTAKSELERISRETDYDENSAIDLVSKIMQACRNETNKEMNYEVVYVKNTGITLLEQRKVSQSSQ
jgi:20S proteasome subunit alpha 7